MKRKEIIADNALDSEDTKVLASLQSRRRSCRKYQSDAVPDKVLKRVFALAQLAASWCNAQPWEVIVTKGRGTDRFREVLYQTALDDAVSANDPETRSSIRRRSDLPMPAGYSGVRKERRRKSGTQLYSAMGVMGDRDASAKLTLENFRFFGAPHAAIFVSADELGPYGVLDTGGYISNLMLVMESFGISCVAQAALALYGDVVHDFFDIPEDRIVVCGMSFGYPEESHPSYTYWTDRADVSEVVRWYV